MNELELKYGCNPNQKPARIFLQGGGDLPLEVLNGKPGYINFLDALNSWQLVKELKEATGLPAAASFKHVSPAGAAVGLPLSETDKAIYFVDPAAELSPIACAYIRARGADRLCSYGDWAALSDTCDAATAAYLKHEVSDGIIAPDYTPEALEILKSKKKGNYNVVKIDPNYIPAPQEHKDVFGITFEQGRNNFQIDESLLNNLVTENQDLPKEAKIDMIVALITLKYTQSNSVCYVKDGQAIGVGAGQQSRIHCTRLAGQQGGQLVPAPASQGSGTASSWTASAGPTGTTPSTSTSPMSMRTSCGDGRLAGRVHSPVRSPSRPRRRRTGSPPRPGVTVGSDAFFPFGDNVERARKSGVSYIVEPGGSIRDDNVIDTANRYNMVMAFTGMRLFHH